MRWIVAILAIPVLLLFIVGIIVFAFWSFSLIGSIVVAGFTS